MDEEASVIRAVRLNRLLQTKLKFRRLQGCQPDVEVWQRILQVRTLVLTPGDDPMMWIKFSNLCRKNDRMVLAEKTINSLLSPEKVSLSMVGKYMHSHYYRISDYMNIITRKHLLMWSMLN